MLVEERNHSGPWPVRQRINGIHLVLVAVVTFAVGVWAGNDHWFGPSRELAARQCIAWQAEHRAFARSYFVNCMYLKGFR